MRFLAALFSAAIMLGLLGLGGAWMVYEHYSQDLPDYSRLKNYRPPVSTRLYAGDGRLLAEYASERRVFTPIAKIPDLVKQAFISAEDQDFYRHKGIDPMGIVRAVLTNAQNMGEGRRPVGASTITQQVAKNMLLTNEVSIKRKVREVILAQRIEAAMSKDQILEIYLNEIFLGMRSYGVTTAAQNYFGKALAELTISEAAYLAALPKAPNNYHPVRNKEAALERRNWVLRRMREDKVISRDAEEAAAAHPILIQSRPAEETVTAGYFAEEVRRTLADAYGKQNVFEAGLTVRTSLDPDVQAVVTQALRNGLVGFDRKKGWRGDVTRLPVMADWPARLAKIPLPAGAEGWELAVVLAVGADFAELGLASGVRGRIPLSEVTWARKHTARGLGPEIRTMSDVLSERDVVLVEALPPDSKEDGKKKGVTEYGLRQVPLVQGAVVVMNPHNGRVLAMAGGFSPETSSFNRATQAQRQPGSAFKPFIYLAAFDNGYTPSSRVLDAPVVLDQGPGMPKWAPSNYKDEYHGPTTLRVGLEKSRNTITVRLAHALGMSVVRRYARDFGIAEEMPPYLSSALGSIETTPLKLTTAYAMLVNGGRKVAPSFVDRVQDRDGKTIWRADSRACKDCTDVNWRMDLPVPVVPDVRPQIADPRTTAQIVGVLEGVVQRGTATSLKKLGRPIAGKTGTTNESRDVWFIGMTPDLVIGVYVGYDEPKSLGKRVTGGVLAAPIFAEIAENILKDTPAIPFRMPPGLRLVRVNAVTGLLAEPGDPKAIWEPYLPGTEPQAGVIPPVLNLGPPDNFREDAAYDPNATSPTGASNVPLPAPAPSEAVTSGTGGLY